QPASTRPVPSIATRRWADERGDIEGSEAGAEGLPVPTDGGRGRQLCLAGEQSMRAGFGACQA
ncbi:hypothetical protein RZS08_43180, partial [Arthrospira platensis SPKY1]|nr:hypothetical protein [Arthrospira platensis SPKY1]